MVFVSVTKQVMLYDIGTKPGKSLPVGIIEPLYKPATVTPPDEKPKSKGKEEKNESKPGSKDSQRSNVSCWFVLMLYVPVNEFSVIMGDFLSSWVAPILSNAKYLA